MAAKDKLKKMTLDQRKKFVELFNSGSPSTAYTAYLGLSNADVIELKESIEEITKSITKDEKAKEERLDKARLEAVKYNESMQKTGKAPEKEQDKSVKKWEVPAGREREFAIDIGTRNISFLMNKWCNNKDLLLKEIEKYEAAQ